MCRAAPQQAAPDNIPECLTLQGQLGQSHQTRWGQPSELGMFGMGDMRIGVTADLYTPLAGTGFIIFVLFIPNTLHEFYGSLNPVPGPLFSM